MRGAGDFFGTRQHGLPPLKLADLAGDARLLEQAQQAADTLMARDPQLKTAPLLRQRIVRLFEQHGEGSFNWKRTSRMTGSFVLIPSSD